MRAAIVTGALLVAAGALATLALAAAPSPSKLYQSLLITPYPDSQLPSSFSSAKVSLQNPSSTARHYHVVGEVNVAVDGPDPDDGIGFDVYPTRADAIADLAHPAFVAGEKIHVIPGGVPGFTKLPGHMYAGSITGKNAFGKTITDGVTVVAVVQGSVLVEAFTDSSDSTDSGNIPAAIALLHSALKHLAKVSPAR